jgi:DNA-directed RNA polymerase specialized sigma24 family protein
MLEVPVGTVKSRCSRARVELAKVLGRMLGADPETGVAS